VVEYPQDDTERVWLEDPHSGLVVPHNAPRFLFRGEPGQFPKTTPMPGRPETWEFDHSSGRHMRLGPAECASFQGLSTRLLQRFTSPDYNLSALEALAVLQHYGLPTVMLDFTANPGTAMTFATIKSGKNHDFGRICVLPTESFKKGLTIAEFPEHRWAVRASRQEAFGVWAGADAKFDLKSEQARTSWGVQWYEFPITPLDREQSVGRYQKLVSTNDDPTAGILRHELIEDVEHHGKLLPDLMRWLVYRPIPMVPRAYKTIGLSDYEALVDHVPFDEIGELDQTSERDQTERYLSLAYADDSRDHLHCVKLEVGSILVDPRTWHPIG
jgi:hypothetical protein